MSFKRYSSLPYNKKLSRCNNALWLLEGRQQKVNQQMNILRNKNTMEEIFFNILQLNGQLRQTIFHLFDCSISVKHVHARTKFNPFKLKEVTEDICKLISFLESVSKSDSDMDLLFVTVHSIKETQIHLFERYYIKHDKRVIFDFKFLTGKELKKKYRDLKKEFMELE